MMTKHHFSKGFMAMAMVWAMALLPMASLAQTQVKMPKNRYKVQDDVQAGREAAAQVEQLFPIIRDAETSQYIQRVGENLVAAIPPQFRQPAFDYNFKVVNASDINAFALPGGPMYVNRGMIEAARNEGEMVGVMSHEIAHVALRHATAQATKQGSWKNQLGTIGLILGGAVLGGQTGAQLGMLGAQIWQTRYSREYETQADVLGSQIMARAGYDPRDLANMFQTIAQTSGSRGPEFLSSHPDPGNRYQNINREAQLLEVSSNPIKLTRDFERVKSKLRSMPPARTMQQIQESAQGQGGQNPMAGGRYSQNIQLPSTSYRVYQSGNWIRMNVPNNWREFQTQSDVTFAPEGAYGDQGVTHGAMIGVYRGQSSNLSQNSQDLVNGLLQSNSYLRQSTNFQSSRMAGRQAYVTQLSGRSPVTGRTEVVTIYTAQLRSGELFYFAAISPQDAPTRYNTAFRSMLNSIRLNDSNM
ncbi:MAG: M48 family metallopeptidase [Pyrinomonadaceae bacterium]|nr:M48 family metallopeptidase [Pyrinomonadaceae bacterium]